MKYEVTKDEDGCVNLKLGLNHSVLFKPNVAIEDIVEGVETLIQNVVGVSAFELCTAVMTEFNKDLEPGEQYG
jgi:hypothetical protein